MRWNHIRTWMLALGMAAAASFPGLAAENGLDVSNLTWDVDSGSASWTGAADASSYEVRLYMNGAPIADARTVYGTNCNFPGAMMSGSYTFQVRAVDEEGNRGEWETSEPWNISWADIGSMPEYSYYGNSSGGPGDPNAAARWVQNEKGWWYQNADQSYPTSCWQQIEGKWYNFNEYGYMRTGWILWNDVWYYCGADGAMRTDTVTPDGYTVGSDGAWVQG